MEGFSKGFFTFSVILISGLIVSEFRRMIDKIQLLNDQLHQKNDELKAITFVDPLTKLNNRRYVQEVTSVNADSFLKLKTFPEVEKRDLHLKHKIMGVFLMDIDNFKHVNDEFGHDVGDKTLVAISQAIGAQVRFDDTIVRWGGEEFLLILPYSKIEYFEQITHKILEAVAQTKIPISEKKSIQVTMSMGGTCFPFNTVAPNCLSFEDIIIISDQLMYISKKGGKNRCTILYPQKNSVDYEYMKLQLQQSPLTSNEHYSVKTVKGPSIKLE